MEDHRTREELETILTAKERSFCWKYIEFKNGSKAAREAGYSENTCAEIAHQNLTKLHIKEYISIIDNNDHIEEAIGLSKIRNVSRLDDIAEDETAAFRDKISAIKEINLMLGYNEPDRVVTTTTIVELTPEERAAKIAALKAKL